LLKDHWPSFGAVLNSVLRLRGLVERLFECPAKHLAGLRKDVAHRILRETDRSPSIEELLSFCIQRRSEGGLNLATDILSLVPDLAVDYARVFLLKDVQRWSREQTLAWHPNDDVWFILLRAAPYANMDKDSLLELMTLCLGAGNRHIRAAAVEGLLRLHTPQARDVLQRLTNEDPDPLIQSTAKEALEEMEV